MVMGVGRSRRVVSVRLIRDLSSARATEMEDTGNGFGGRGGRKETPGGGWAGGGGGIGYMAIGGDD